MEQVEEWKQTHTQKSDFSDLKNSAHISRISICAFLQVTFYLDSADDHNDHGQVITAEDVRAGRRYNRTKREVGDVLSSHHTDSP